MSWQASMRRSLGEHDWIVPDWPAPSRVRAFVTTRSGGVSEGEYASMNLAASSGDDIARVMRNREIVRERLPEAPQWMRQVHGTRVADLDRPAEGLAAGADAAATGVTGRVACVLTADCMPLLLCDAGGARVAVAHAGWRGLAAGVIESTLAALGSQPSRTLAWMGPAIGPTVFEVGPDVRDAFLAADSGADAAFRDHKPGKYMADLYALARRRLERAGVASITGGDFCTFSERDRFFSYRREKKSGRMGAFIWIE
jgi:YfiH family protein